MIGCVCSEVPDAILARAQAASNCSNNQIIGVTSTIIQGGARGDKEVVKTKHYSLEVGGRPQ